MSTREEAATKLVATISEAELSCRIAEAQLGMKRPIGASAEQAMAGVDQDTRERFQRAARAAMEYWRECIQQAGSVN